MKLVHPLRPSVRMSAEIDLNKPVTSYVSLVSSPTLSAAY